MHDGTPGHDERKGVLTNVISRRVAVVVSLPLAWIGPARAADGDDATKVAGTQWPGFNGGYDATRFSSLTQVNAKNVASLIEVVRSRIPEPLSFQFGPVVVGDTMYVTTVKGTYVIAAGY